MNKLLKSIFTLGVVVAVAGGATVAYFSDTETSTGNTFTAGKLDLLVDSTAHYDGMVCTLNPQWTEQSALPQYIWAEESQDSSTYPELIGEECWGTWPEANLGDWHKFIALNDVKPGDSGENTISVHVDDNDAWVRMVLSNIINDDNLCTEPEGDVPASDTTCGPNEGELQENLNFWMWLDEGAIPGFQGQGEDPTEGDNIYQDGETPLIAPGTIDVLGEEWNFPVVVTGGETWYFGVGWELPAEVGNEVQTDSFGFDVMFEAEQARHNAVPSWLVP